MPILDPCLCGKCVSGSKCPELEKALDGLKKFKANGEWFRDHIEDLRKEYLHEYVAIEDGKVIDHDEDFRILIPRLREDYGQERMGDMHVDYIDDHDQKYILLSQLNYRL